MATPKTAFPNRTIGTYYALALIVGVIAFLTAIQSSASPLHAVTVAVVLVALVAGLEAAIAIYRKTGGAPGPAITLGALFQFIQVAAIQTVPTLFSSPITYYALLSWALLFLTIVAEELLGITVSVPGLGGSTSSSSTSGVNVTSTSSVNAVTTAGPGVTSTVDALDSLVNDLATPPKP